MKKRFTFPIRFKILVTLLFVVTAVVSVITFTMAGLFHEDKEAYVHDLAAMVAKGTAEESGAVFRSYASRLAGYARIMSRGDVPAESKTAVVQGLFDDVPELVAISLHESGREVASAFDSKELEAAGLSRSDLEAYRASRPVPATVLTSGRMAVRVGSLAGALRVLDIVSAQDGPEGGSLVLAAILRPAAIDHICSRSQVFETYLVSGDGAVVGVTDTGESRSRTSFPIPEAARPVVEGHAAGKSFEFEDQGRDLIGGFAPVDVAGLTAIAAVPASTAYLASRDLLSGLVRVALVLLVLTAIVSAFWARRLTRPIERLSKAAEAIGQGQFEVNVEVESADEMGTLASSFNRMACELDQRDRALKEAQGQLVQSEKMAAFGLLGAGIAHEVKNPLAGILGCAQLSLRRAEPGSLLHENLALIEKETKRCKTIIENLLKFARQEKTVFETLDVNRPVEDAVAIVRHQLELAKVKLASQLGAGLPPIRGNANQLQQVLMNLMINAQQAMPDGGNVVVSTAAVDGGRVRISVADDGPGMPSDVRRRVFEPFFTTKPNGKGTGLGLSVSYGIVKDHGGEIGVESEPGKGATFSIVLPALAEPRPSVETRSPSATAAAAASELQPTH